MDLSQMPEPIKSVPAFDLGDALAKAKAWMHEKFSGKWFVPHCLNVEEAAFLVGDMAWKEPFAPANDDGNLDGVVDEFGAEVYGMAKEMFEAQAEDPKVACLVVDGEPTFFKSESAARLAVAHYHRAKLGGGVLQPGDLDPGVQGQRGGFDLFVGTFE